MKRIFSFLITVALLSITAISCMKDEPYVGDPAIDEITFTPGAGKVTPDDDVTISAKITDISGIAEAKVLYKVNGGAEQVLDMTAAGNIYTAVIPKQEDQVNVAFVISATSNNNRTAKSPEKTYLVSSTPVEYGSVFDIRLNEVNTTDKYIEIYNPTENPIDISGIKFAKNASDAYYVDANSEPLAAKEGTILEPKSYAVMGCKGADWSAQSTTYLGTSTTGVSGSKSLLVILQDKNGEPIDYFVNTANEAPAVGDAWDGACEYVFTIAGRVPDGTGDWYTVTDGSVCSSNGSSASGDKFTHKIDFNRKPAAVISRVSIEPSTPAAGNEVTVTAIVDNSSAVVLAYTVNSEAEKTVNMVVGATENTFTAAIPAQAAGATVKYKVKATGLNSAETVSDELTYVVSEGGGETPVYDYTKLVLNELNGNAKYIEICNTGSSEIDLKGCYLIKDGATDAKFFDITNSHKVAAGEYIVLYCSGYTGTGTDAAGDLTSTGGLSAKKAVKVELFAPDGTSLDVFERTNTYEDKNNSFSRVPDATGNWYYATPTEGAANGVSNGVISASYSLVINEIDATAKTIELYNNSADAISLANVKLYKDEAEEAIWTGASDMTIAAGAYLVLYSTSYTPAAGETIAENVKFNSGISGKKSVCIQLKDASGNELDAFVRGQKGDAWGSTTLAEDKTHTFSRIGNGTGAWAYADATRGASNGEKTGDIASK